MPEGGFKERIGISEMKKGKDLGKALVAEVVGTFFITYFGCMTCTGMLGSPKSVDISLAFGFAVMISVQALGHMSGGHFNPAVTLGFLSVGKVSIIRAALYIIFQCLGGLAGAAVLKALTPEERQLSLGATTLQGELESHQGFGIEFFLGFVLVLVIFGVCDPNKPESKVPAPLAIGLAIAVGHLACGAYTGPSMNPARSFGPAVVASIWSDHWVYWLGPCLGGIAAAILYTYVLSAASSGEYSPVAADHNNDVSQLKRLDPKDDGQA